MFHVLISHAFKSTTVYAIQIFVFGKNKMVITNHRKFPRSFYININQSRCATQTHVTVEMYVCTLTLAYYYVRQRVWSVLWSS